MKPSKAEALTYVANIKDWVSDIRKSDREDFRIHCDAVAEFITALPDEPAPSPTKPEGLEWLATALKNRNIDVSGASSSAVAAIVALDHYRGEREGNPLANVSSLSPVSDADTVRVKREIYDFLMGADPLEGVYFGDKHPDERGSFWWRSRLRASLSGEAL